MAGSCSGPTSSTAIRNRRAPGSSRCLRAARPNIYTIEKRGKKKLIYQAPWYADGKYAGFVELALEIPETLPHFVRQG